MLYSRKLLQKEIFANHMILLSKEMLAIFNYCIHNRSYTEDIWIQKFVLALIFLCIQDMQNSQN